MRVEAIGLRPEFPRRRTFSACAGAAMTKDEGSQNRKRQSGNAPIESLRRCARAVVVLCP